jgi:hypothetical protein
MDLSVVVSVLRTVHILAGLLWLATAVGVARFGAPANPLNLRRVQMAAAALAFLAGIGLWGLLHAGAPGTREAVLGLGALFGLAAAGVQGALGMKSERLIRQGAPNVEALARKARMADKLAALLLFLAFVAMLAHRFF